MWAKLEAEVTLGDIGSQEDEKFSGPEPKFLFEMTDANDLTYRNILDGVSASGITATLLLDHHLCYVGFVAAIMTGSQNLNNN